jgi:hypothetical protein
MSTSAWQNPVECKDRQICPYKGQAIVKIECTEDGQAAQSRSFLVFGPAKCRFTFDSQILCCFPDEARSAEKSEPEPLSQMARFLVEWFNDVQGASVENEKRNPFHIAALGGSQKPIDNHGSFRH